MGATNGIGAHFFHHTQLPIQGIFVDSCAQATQIAMKTHAIEFCRLTVDGKTRGGIKGNGAQSHGGGVAIYYLATRHQFGYHLIYMRVIGPPQLSMRHVESLIDGGFPLLRHTSCYRLRHATPFGIVERLSNAKLAILFCKAFDGCIEGDGCLMAFHRWQNLHAPLSHPNLRATQ